MDQHPGGVHSYGAPAPPQSTPVPARRPTWVIVLLTLGAVAALALAFVGGLVTGVVMSDAAKGVPQPGTTPLPPNPGSSLPSTATTGTDTGTDTDTGTGTDSALDPCLVGTWQTVDHTESSETDKGKVTITGIKRKLSITPDGVETVTYDPAATVTVTTEQGTAQASYTGTVVYGVTSSAGQLSFSLTSAQGKVLIIANGKTTEQELKPGTGTVSYTCSANRFTQQGGGFSASYTRVS